MKEEYRQAFQEEAAELLLELERALLELEETPEDGELIGRAFRALHTIKGSGAMFGYDDIAGFTHELETAFDLVRSGALAVSKPLIDLTLSACDCIRGMLHSCSLDGDNGDAGRITEAIQAMLGGAGEAELAAPPPSEPAQQEESYRIGFRPNRELFKQGTNPLLLLAELREMGPCRIVARTEAIPPLETLDPEECHISWDIFLTTNRGIDAIRDVFIFVEDSCQIDIERLSAEEEDASKARLGEILVKRGLVAQDALEEVLKQQRPIGEMLVTAGLVHSTVVESALAEQQQIRELRQRQHHRAAASSVRVPSERLDRLVDLVGELVTVQARLTQTAAEQDNPELVAIAEEVERLTSELRDSTMSIRMLPIGSTFSTFKRLVRDLARELGKEVTLTTEGAETELDKTVIERLNDPLVHLIRNSIDHGIEIACEREAAGKPRQGTIHLSAVHSGAHVLISISDDGAGFNAEAILAKAVEKELIAPDVRLTEKEIFALVFHPGFSTAERITNVSGRGVGMDVVKRSIETLRGSIEVSSTPGAGSVITLKLPLTLAIIDGLLVQVGAGFFVMPLLLVEECVELTHADVERANGRNLTVVRGEIVPYIRLRDEFASEGRAPDIEQIVITEVGGMRVGFVVDRVIGEHQTVIKGLGRFYQEVEGISGATILGDGTVALILDLPKLVQHIEADEQSRMAAPAL